MTRRFRAPAGNGEVLADPPFSEVPRLVEENRRRLDRTDVVIGGLSLRDLRALARREALELASVGRVESSRPDAGRGKVADEPSNPRGFGFAARTDRHSRPTSGLEASTRPTSPEPDAPLILAGHQPELSHPGVWVKHFALNGLARRVGGVPLNLIVDNDTLKTSALRVPYLDGGRGPKAVADSIPFDRLDGEVPYEDRRVLDPECFRTFPERVAEVTKYWNYVPLLPVVWTADEHKPGEAFTAMRVRREQAWGCENLELRVSELSHTEAFARFVWQVLNDLPRFRDVYNSALADYRRTNGLKGASHPAPDLAVVDGFIEAPFWTRYAGPHQRRAKWFVRGVGSNLEYQVGALPLGPFVESGDIASLVPRLQRYFAIRPRALTLTLFARVCLGDFFIHGIGGGKYDEVTDAIIRDYFGIEPPAYQVLSATLHLPLPGFPAGAADVAHAERHSRDLHWNPQRYLTKFVGRSEDIRSLVYEKVVLVAAEPPRADRVARRAWFRALQSVTERLRPFVRDLVAPAEAELEQAKVEAAANAVLRRRDYSWVLCPEETLRPFLQRFLDV